ncbi:MAG: bifunctional 3-phosphoshikimate 1-carboxyvinyltransferase/cytidylate kinase [Burkholderiales bacterium]|nr:MAG: bifunctional 3-phosphoshikimate 1-carboxyvinyltransferase/cytidylate kinase [Burkholderiales bacterium]
MYQTTFLDIPPLRRAGGLVRLPGSKSISNRVLLLAALSEGTTTITDLLDSDDTRVMLDALTRLGCEIRHAGPDRVQVTGLGTRPPAAETRLLLGNAGTAMRPLTAALAVLTSLHGGRHELSGVARMHERPIADLVDALRQLGCAVQCLGQDGYPPLAVGDGRPRPLDLDRPVRVRGDVSSQFLTALLLALPLAAREREVVIEVVGELISRPYIEITLNLLQRFGVAVRREGWQRFTIAAGSRYLSPGSIPVEGDASSASYFVALGALASARAGQDGITIEGVGLASIQGDIRFIEAARQMGAEISGEANRLHIRRGAWPLRAIDLDCNHIPDAAMTLAVMALYADGPSTLRNIASWRVKETDRIAAMARECRKFGAQVEEGADHIRITPPARWTTASIHTYDDHRVAMCFSLAAFNPAGLPVRIEDPRCVGKTFPDYFETLFSVCEADSGDVPVICIDGPSASGKGTLAALVAERLGYHLLDSGALYRLVGLAAQRAGLATDDASLGDPAQAARLGELAAAMQVRFEGQRVFLDGTEVGEALRSEAAGMAASRVSAVPQVRQALLGLQHRFRRLPGLVADGRDMGTVIFPDAPMKVFLTASAEQRAIRRHKQLISKGISANMESLLADLVARDARDSAREHAPLKAAADALLLDNSALGIEESVQQVLDWWQGKTVFSTS